MLRFPLASISISLLLAAALGGSSSASFSDPRAGREYGAARTSDERVEHNPNGQLKFRCKLDREGRLNGKYVEYYDTRVVAVETAYKKDEISGKYASFHPNGEAWIQTTYKNGVISGKFVEQSASGERKITGVYKRGLREGDFLVKSGKQTLRVQGWKADELVTVDEVEVHPRPLEGIRATLEEIYDPANSWGGEGLGFTDAPSGKRRPTDAGSSSERDACLRRLLAYRFLAGVAWRDMLVSARFNHHADAAARLLFAVGALGADPENPGWDKKLYKHAAHGAASCNQAYAATLDEALTQGMAERGTGGVGFRTSMLDPKLMATGFGRFETVNTIWFEDESRSFEPDYEMICFPAPGYMPTEYFGKQHSWSIELNPANHTAIAFKNDVSVHVYRLDQDWVRDGAELELAYTNFWDRTIAFRPLETDCTAGARYEVQVEGIRHDKVGSHLTYFVEFVEAVETEPDGPGKLDANPAH
jgi:hypothetical protein